VGARSLTATAAAAAAAAARSGEAGKRKRGEGRATNLKGTRQTAAVEDEAAAGASRPEVEAEAGWEAVAAVAIGARAPGRAAGECWGTRDEMGSEAVGEACASELSPGPLLLSRDASRLVAFVFAPPTPPPPRICKREEDHHRPAAVALRLRLRLRERRERERGGRRAGGLAGSPNCCFLAASCASWLLACFTSLCLLAVGRGPAGRLARWLTAECLGRMLKF
jgi:hypothetical protein